MSSKTHCIFFTLQKQLKSQLHNFLSGSFTQFTSTQSYNIRMKKHCNIMDNNETHCNSICHFILQIKFPHTNFVIFDSCIALMDICFMIFLLYKLPRVYKHLAFSQSGIIAIFYSLIWLQSLIQLARSLYSLRPLHGDSKSSSSSTTTTAAANDPINNILWFIVRHVTLFVESAILVFGICCVRLTSNKSLLLAVLLTFVITFSYSASQGICEFVFTSTDSYIIPEESNVNRTIHEYISLPILYQHGGIYFFIVSSFLFFLVYSGLIIIRILGYHTYFELPNRWAFYFYCVCLSLMNSLQLVGSLLFYFKIAYGLCLLSLMVFCYFTLFNPLIYAIFLQNYFKVCGLRDHLTTISTSLPIHIQQQLQYQHQRWLLQLPRNAPPTLRRISTCPVRQLSFHSNNNSTDNFLGCSRVSSIPDVDTVNSTSASLLDPSMVAVPEFLFLGSEPITHCHTSSRYPF